MFGGVIDACPTDVFKWNGEGCFSQDVQLCSMYYVMVIREVTTHDPKVFTVFLLDKGILFFPFIMLRRFPWRAVRRVEVQLD